MPNLDRDIQGMLRGMTFGPAHSCLIGGRKMHGYPGYASKDDVAVGILGISGNTRTLTLRSADCGNLVTNQDTVIWQGKKYLVINTKLLAHGALTVAYLSEDL